MTQRKKRSLSNEKKGLWIQCCDENCKKWRFVKEYKDPLSVPEKWFCSENFDKKFASCDIPEEKADDDLVESEYVPGNIVWAKITGYPWWPAIIDNCPVKKTFYELGSSEIPLRYHVTFLEEKENHCQWIKSDKIKPYKEDDGNQPKKAKLLQNSQSVSLCQSLEIAKLALTLDNEKRLKKYSISLRIDDLLKSNNIPKRRKENVKYVSSNIKENNVKKNLEISTDRKENSSQNQNNVKKNLENSTDRKENSSQKQNVKKTLDNTNKKEKSSQKPNVKKTLENTNKKEKSSQKPNSSVIIHPGR
ncbi:zinc finger CW-type PWWP domain protein 1-like [Leptopilina heterotoma]|uniref:zinc finger CW-type PWWP domain protein 1-like n=1 Tax=Leptopilina heterotoma TaxID=63436 RepID=UPI001CAA0FCC|nr:zinc finger CW-type PWWP domain protein 1-like [Leptopilina heterotoma]